MSMPILKPKTIRIAAIVLVAMSAQARADWPTLAGDATRAAFSETAPSSLSFALWELNTDLNGDALIFEGPATPVVFDGRVYAYAKHFNASGAYVSNKIVAVDASTGGIEFETVIDRGVLDSWSSPTIDATNRVVIIGSGSTLYGINADDGNIDWQRPLDRSVVNATAVLADDPAVGRAFITDYTGFGLGASLYCINTSPFDVVGNPFEPGEIVWQESIGGASGATPAYRDGVVYVACTAESTTPPGQKAGHVSAYDVVAAPGQRLLWRATLASAGVADQGFFGGVSLTDSHVYAASYNTSGTGDNSTLVKIRASDGAIEWTIPCERTNSIPIVANDRVYVAAGLLGFGSVPKVQAFQDLGTSATKLWDTYADTAGALIVGGWTHQPVLQGDVLYCGTVSSVFPFFGPNTDLSMLDVSLTPNDPSFVVDHVPGMGSSPAVCGGRLFTTGATGLFAIATKGDFCGSRGLPDGDLTIDDIPCFAAMLADGNASASDVRKGDFNEDGALDGEDIPGFIAALIGN